MATLFPSGVSSMPTSSACSMTRANLPGMTRLRLSVVGTTRIGAFNFVNWVKASSFLLLTNNIRSSAASTQLVVMTRELPPAISEAAAHDDQTTHKHRGKNAFEMKGTKLPSRILHALDGVFQFGRGLFQLPALNCERLKKGSFQFGMNSFGQLFRIVLRVRLKASRS